MRIRCFKPVIKEMVTVASAFAGTSTSLPQAALGERPADAYRQKRRIRRPRDRRKNS